MFSEIEYGYNSIPLVVYLRLNSARMYRQKVELGESLGIPLLYYVM